MPEDRQNGEDAGDGNRHHGADEQSEAAPHGLVASAEARSDALSDVRFDGLRRLRGRRRGRRRLQPRARRVGEGDIARGDRVLQVEYLELGRDLRLVAAGRGAPHAERGRADPDHDDRHRAPHHVAAAPSPRPPTRLPRQRPGRDRAILMGHREQPPGHRVIGGVELAEGAQLALEPPQLRGLGPAHVAPGQVRVGPVKLRPGQFPVDQGGDQRSEMAHRSRTRRSRCARAARSCARPRWMRLRTVPSFTPMVAAISS